MKKATKAILFSALVFPGSGYFFLGKARYGWSCIIAVIAVIAVYMIEAHSKAQAIAQKILNGEIPYSIAAVIKQIHLVPGTFEPTLLENLGYGLIGMWFISLIHCAVIGNKLDNIELK